MVSNATAAAVRPAVPRPRVEVPVRVAQDEISAQQRRNDFPVTLCHRTRSERNPWVIITVDNNSVLQAHLRHGDFIVRANRPCPPEDPGEPGEPGTILVCHRDGVDREIRIPAGTFAEFQARHERHDHRVTRGRCPDRGGGGGGGGGFIPPVFVPHFVPQVKVVKPVVVEKRVVVQAAAPVVRAAPAPKQQLARTGFDTSTLALIGVGLILAGIALRIGAVARRPLAMEFAASGGVGAVARYDTWVRLLRGSLSRRFRDPPTHPVRTADKSPP